MSSLAASRHLISVTRSGLFPETLDQGVESASALLELRADPELESRIEELRSKANEGTLTPAEDTEYKEVVEAIDIVSTMQAKARRDLSL